MHQYKPEIEPHEVGSNNLNIGTHYGMSRAAYHRHSEVELSFMERGSLLYFYGGQRFELKEGQCALFWASIPHQIIQEEEQTILHWVTVPLHHFLQWRLRQDFTQQILCGKFVSGWLDTSAQMVIEVLKQWSVELKKRPPEAEHEEYQRIVLLEVEAYVRRFALIVGDKPFGGQMSSSQDASKVELMACFIAEHHTENIHVEEIAAQVYLHPNYAMLLFRKHFGVSMLEYLTQYRLAHAQRLLMTSDKTTSEIALCAGFGSVSRFYVAFKDRHGVTPARYRSMYAMYADVP